MPDALLDALAQAPREVPPEADAVLAWTLADFLACVLSTDEPCPVRATAFDDDGVTGTASRLALRASAQDRDDVDWSLLTHPGAVVWSTVLATAARGGCDGAAVARAAYVGYRAMATMAHRFGPGHRARWHVTATAGGFGAAAAAGAVLRLSPQEQSAAFAHTAAATGGLGQAAVERRGAAAFNRAAAASLGIQAARAAAYGAVAVDAPLDGERALLALTDGERAGVPGEPGVIDGLAGVGPRTYPVSGFGQGAVGATAALRGRCRDSVLAELVVEVAEPAARLMDGSAGGAWWSLVDAVGAAWVTGDPFDLEPSDASRALVDRVRTVVGDVPVGGARVRAVTDRGTEEAEAAPPAAGPDLDRKWSTMLAAADRSEDVAALAAAILREGVTPDHLHLLTDPPPTERPR